MKKILLAFMLLTLLAPVGISKGSLEGELAALQKRVRQTQQKIEQERSYQKALKSNYGNAYQNWLTAKAELDTINNRLIKLKKDIASIRKDIANTKAKISTKGSQVDKKRKEIGQLLTVIHKYRNTRFVDYVFSANDFSELLTRNRLMNQLLKKAMEAITDLQDESASLIALKNKLKDQESDLNDLLAQTKKDQQRVANLQTHQQNLMNSITQSQTQSKQMEDEYERQMERDSEAIKVFIRKIQEERERKAREAKKPQLKWNGKFIWPLANGKVVGAAAEYGWRIHPIFGYRKFHYGLDVDAPLGTPVLACADGVVELASWFGGYGNCIIINHGDGWTTTYGHLLDYRVKVNDTVKQGQTIALCGSTGLSTEPHVHLEVRKNGNTVSPRDYLSPR